jgi:hypothetical protein
MTTPRVQNVTRVFRNASQTDTISGMDWYARARRLAVLLDPEQPERSAGIIAVMSPLLSWPQNVRQAKRVYAGKGARGLSKNVAKAAAIYNGAIPEDIVSGPKVTSFFTNILYPENGTPVTIDRHAIDIACGKVLNDTDRAMVIKGKAGYARIAGMYRRAAEILSAEFGAPILPQQVQAVTWVSWRNTMIKNNHGDA